MQQFRPLTKTDKMQAPESANGQPVATFDAFSPGASCPAAQSFISFRAGPQSAFDKDQDPSAAFGQTKTLSVPPSQTPLPDTTQAPSNTARGAKRLIVIHAEKKRKKAPLAADTPSRHLNPRLRRVILLLTTLVILIGTMATLAPLSTGQNGFNLPSGLSTLIRSAQNGLQNLTLQDNSQPSSNTNANTGLAPMIIPQSQLVAIAQQDATSAGIPPTYFVRQINLESSFNPNAVSPSGAEGIAQFEPATAAGLGINPFDPVQALNAAAQMMGRAYRQYGDYAKALAAYNAGSANLQNAENTCGAQWLSCMPAQTQNYVAVIMGV